MSIELPKSVQQRLNGLSAQLRHGPVGQFFSWWAGELFLLLPASWRARILHNRRKLILRRVGPELEVSIDEAGELRVLDAYDLDQDAELQHQQIRDVLHERDLLEAQRALLLAPDDVLMTTVSLPIAAESNLHQALAFDMDRQTPFRAEDVYFDYRVLERNRDNGLLTIALVVVPRKAVEESVEVFRVRGLAPTVVDVRAETTDAAFEPGENEPIQAGFNLLPPEKRFRPPNRLLRFNALLAVIAAVLLTLLMFQSLAWREHQLELLGEAIEEVDTEAKRVQRIREQIKDAAEAAGFLQAQRAQSQPVVAVMAEITRVLPDDTFLERLSVEDGSVQMQGKSSNAQQLIELVNQSPMLDDASFQGPTRLDNRSGKEIFDLSAAVKAQEADDATGP